MLYLVYVKVPTDIGNRIDFEEGGPGKVIGFIMNRFKPQAAYAEAGKRNFFVVADLNEAQMTEFMLVASKQMGAYPRFIPLIPGAAVPEMAEKAIEEVKKAL